MKLASSGRNPSVTGSQTLFGNPQGHCKPCKEPITEALPSGRFFFFRLFFSFIVIALAFFHCDLDTTVESANAEKVAHDVRISQNETWTSDKTHVVSSEIVIDNATLTIEPGTTIQFAAGAGLMTTTGGAILAQGSSDKPIIFTGTEATKGFWNAIRFASGSNSQSCKLIHCVIEFGGGGDSESAMIICQDVSPTIAHCQIKNSAALGVLISGAAGPADFSYNTITLGDKAPLGISATSIPCLNPNCDFTGNAEDHIQVTEGGSIQKSALWQTFNVPYQISENIQISDAILRIASGAELRFEAATSIRINQDGGIWAAGNATEKIVFTSTEAQKGYWEGISFFDGARDDSCSLTYCIIEYGGGNPQRPANIYAEYANPAISSCEVKSGIGYGVVFEGISYPRSFFNNTITENEQAPIRINVENAHRISRGNYFGNAENYIELAGGNIFNTCEWENTGIRFRLIGSLNIINSTLTIRPGTAIELAANVSINVKMRGGFIADGADNQIIITGSVPQAGYWDYIHFEGDSDDNACLLNQCLISYGGGDDGWPGSVYCENASPTITNCRIENSATWGIFLAGDAQPVLDGTKYAGNLRGDVWP
ncbi:hypothetical protein JXJ21_05585 [candidate division KSB1 bacterium]|nr:hypothetical protein [candidate division KSB1 bacterium]